MYGEPETHVDAAVGQAGVSYSFRLTTRLPMRVPKRVYCKPYIKDFDTYESIHLENRCILQEEATLLRLHPLDNRIRCSHSSAFGKFWGQRNIDLE